MAGILVNFRPLGAPNDLLKGQRHEESTKPALFKLFTLNRWGSMTAPVTQLRRNLRPTSDYHLNTAPEETCLSIHQYFN